MEFTSRLSEIEGRRYDEHDGVRRYFAEMADAWREWHNDPGEIVEVSPDAVLVDNMFHAVGRDSGMPVTLRSAIVFVFSGEKIVRCFSYPTRDEALRAAGIEARRRGPLTAACSRSISALSSAPKSSATLVSHSQPTSTIAPVNVP